MEQITTLRTQMWRASRLCPWTHTYLLYTAPLADLPRHRKMQFHFFAADTQLYISFSPNNDLELASTIAKI